MTIKIPAMAAGTATISEAPANAGLNAYRINPIKCVRRRVTAERSHSPEKPRTTLTPAKGPSPYAIEAR